MNDNASAAGMPPQRSQPLLRAKVARACRRLVAVRGWQSLVNRVVPEHSAVFSIRNGETAFAGDIGSFIDRQVYLFGGYDSAAISAFIARIEPNRRGTILDIGANAGTHTLQFARAFAVVHSFEPNPMLWRQFEHNVAINALDNVRLHKIGLGDRDADLMLHLIDKPNFGLGTFSTADQYDRPLLPAARCQVRNAGAYLAEKGIGPVDAIKIDVQGFEPQVLHGLADVLKRDQPVIWCEVGAGTLNEIRTTDQLTDLIPFPFRCFEITPLSRWTGNSVTLRERCGDLCGGDYVILPSGNALASSRIVRDTLKERGTARIVPG